MHKLADSYCLFQGEKVYFRGKEELPEGTLWSWESGRKDDAGSIRIGALCRGDLILRMEITALAEGRPITTRFDSSLKLVRDDKFRNEVHYMLLAKEHEKRLSNLSNQLRAVYHLHSSKELFYIQALKREIEEAENAKLPAPQEFSSTTKIGGYKNCFEIYFPREVSRAAGFRAQMMGEWLFEDGSLVFAPLRKRQYPVRVIRASSSTEVTVPEELVYLKGIYNDTNVKWFEEEPGKLSLRIVGESAENSFKVYYSRRANTYLVTIPYGFEVGSKENGFWSDEGEKLVLYLTESARHIKKLNKTNEYERFEVTIPIEIAKKAGVDKWGEVGFSIDGKGRVVISPKQA